MGVTLQILPGDVNTLVLTEVTDFLDVTINQDPDLVVVRESVPEVEIEILGGASAYEIARSNGFVGTEQQWLASLVGPEGSAADLQNYYTKPQADAITDTKAPLASPAFTGTVSGITKSMVGLGNVDNTSDVNKPVSTAQQTALDTRVSVSAFNAHTNATNNPHFVTKGQVGLGSVDNTSDTSKPISTATQNALDTKAPLASPTFTGTVSGISKAAVGLGNVDNTADTAKPVSTAQQAALDNKQSISEKGAANGYAGLDGTGKVPSTQLPSYVDDVAEASSFATLPATGETGKIYVTLNNNKTYRWSGSAYVEIAASPGSTDAVPEGSTNLYYTNSRASAAAPVQSVASKTGAVSLVKGDVGLGNVDNTSDANKPISSATQTALNAKEAAVSAGTTAQYWRGDKSWQTLNKAAVGLSNVDNTADASKPISTATQFALDSKAPLASPTFTGTVSGITKSMIDLANVDNTSDASKPISTATQTALNAKANAANLYLDATVGANAVVWDGSTDDAGRLAALATSAVALGIALKLPPGTGMVTTWAPPSGLVLVGAGAGKTIIKMHPSANGANARLINVSDTTGVQFYGLTIDGNKSAFSAVTTEQKHGIYATNVSGLVLEDVIIQNCKGDGLYVGKGSGHSTDVTARRLRCLNNHRNGMSITDLNKGEFVLCDFSSTSGTAPQAGVDIEPNDNTYVVQDIRFIGCRFTNNAAYGFAVTLYPGGSVQERIKLVSCVIDSNLGNGVYLYGAVGVEFNSTDITNNAASGVLFQSGAIKGTTFIGGRITGNAFHGINCQPVSGSTVTNTKVIGTYIADNGGATPNTYYGMLWDVAGSAVGSVDGLLVSGVTSTNRLTSNQKYGAYFSIAVSNLVADNNDFRSNATSAAIFNDESATRWRGVNVGVTTVTGVSTTSTLASHVTRVSTSQTGPITVTLPTSPEVGVDYTIWDASGTGATNVVTIVPNTGQTFANVASLALDENYKVVRLVFRSNKWYVLGATTISGFEPVITAGTTAQYWRGDKTWQTLNKSAVGLANVDNTADTAKPVSTAQQTALDAKQSTSEKGAANGYASLDGAGKVPSAQLPAYVDDVLEYANLAALPGTGAAGLIYVTIDNNKTYRWSGSGYVEISASPGSTDSISEGSTNLYYTNARASAAAPVQSVASKTGAVTLVKGDVGLGNVDNTSDATKNSASAILTNKSLDSTTTMFADTTDSTKKVRFSLTNIQAGTTRVWNVPDSDGTVVGLTQIQVLSNKTVEAGSFTIRDATDITKKVQFVVSGVTTGTTRTITVPDANITLAGISIAQTLSNKTLDASTTTIADTTDATKKAQFAVSGITTGTTRTITVPNSDLTLVGTSTAQTLTNKTLDGTNVWADATDSTKKVQFSFTNITTGTTRTINFPDTNVTLASVASTQTFSNKTMSGTNNTFSNISADSTVDGSTNKVLTAANATLLGTLLTGATAATNSTTALRTSTGTIKAAAPSANDDLSTKLYVDNISSTLSGQIATKADSSSLATKADISQIPVSSMKHTTANITGTASSTALVDIDATNLAFSIAANETWYFSFKISVRGDTAADITFGIAAPTGCTTWAYIQGQGPAAASQSAALLTADITAINTASGTIGLLGSTTSSLISIDGWITATSTAGTVKLQAGQGTSNATAHVVQAGSLMIASRV